MSTKSGKLSILFIANLMKMDLIEFVLIKPKKETPFLLVSVDNFAPFLSKMDGLSREKRIYKLALKEKDSSSVEKRKYKLLRQSLLNS